MKPLKTIAAMLLLACGSTAMAAVKGDYVEVRTASVFAGPCHYNGELVTTGRDAMMAWNIAEGSFDNVNLAGVKAVAVVSATENLSDSNARARIAARIDRLALGNPGDVKPVGGGVSELRIDYGPGYRVYYARTDRVVYLLLCGGTKATQDVDIKRAIEMTAARAPEVSAALQRKPKKRK